ncbi:MAG: hypothetical protein ACXU8S_07405 [Phenylobacterium sp.]
MTTVNYPSPVTVNGYSCKNCTEVDEAKKHVDPAHPKDGPYGVDAKDHAPSAFDAKTQTPAVTFGGALAGASAPSNSPAQASSGQPGQQLNVFA